MESREEVIKKINRLRKDLDRKIEKEYDKSNEELTEISCKIDSLIVEYYS